MRTYLLAGILLIQVNFSFGQEMSGRIIDADTKTAIPFASVYITELQIGVVCDSAGNFAFNNSLPEYVTLKISASFYETKIIHTETIKDLVFELEESHLELEDVIISAPGKGLARDNAFRVERLAVKDLYVNAPSNLSEAIGNINGVQTASMGIGSAKPVIRGMQGIRVLTLLNGMRIESQQWGGDHGLGIYELGISHVEVIKGPSSLLYGPDAFGGVVYLADAPFATQNSQEISVGSKFESINIGTRNTINYKISNGIFRFSVAGLHANYADYQLPNKKYAQNTRYSDNGAKMTLGISKKNWVINGRYMYSNGKTGIPGETESEVIVPSEFQIDLQERKIIIPFQTIENHFVSIDSKIYKKRSSFYSLLGFTSNRLGEFEESLTERAMDVILINIPYSFQWKYMLNENWSVVNGIQGMYQINTNNPNAEEMLIPDFYQNDNGVYSIAYYGKGLWDIQFGARYDIRSLHSDMVDFDARYSSPNFAFGVVRSNVKSTVRMNLSSGFRAPHLSELLADGEHHGTLRYEIGDVSLQPEKANQIDFSWEIQNKHLEFVLNPFYNYISNYIQIVKQDSIIDGLQVYKYKQSPEVQLIGTEIGIHYHPHFAHFLHFESSYSYIYAEELNGINLSMIPQGRINSFFKLELAFKGKFNIENISLQHQYYFEQTKVSSYETPTKAYHVMNFAVNSKIEIKTPIEFSVGVKNLLNASYINHLSRLKNIEMPFPGRSYFISLKYTIASNLKSK